jgi:hypothetical protein
MKTSKVSALVALIVLALGVAIASWSQGPPANPSLGSILPNYSFPAMVFTATAQTKTQALGGVSYATIDVTAVGLTTATFQVKASNNGGASYDFNVGVAPYVYTSGALSAISQSPITITSAPAVYVCNLAGFTNVEITTSATFTATSLTAKITGTSNHGVL